MMSIGTRIRCMIPRAVWLMMFLSSGLSMVMAQSSGNLLIENGDFEAGINGLGVRPLVLLNNWDKFVAPSIDDTTAAHGKRSLKLVNGSGQDVFEFMTRAFKIENAQGPATVSFYAKTDTPGATVSVVLRAGWKRQVEKGFTLTDQWQRYEITNAPANWYYPQGQAGNPGVYYLFMSFPSKDKPWKTIWLDGVQVEMGVKATPFKQRDPVDFAFTFDKRIKVYFPNESIRVTLRASGPNIAKQPIKLQLDEMLTGETQPEQTITLQPDGDDDHGKYEWTLPAMPRGSYRLTVKTADGKRIHRQAFGVIQSLADRPHEQKAFFGGSIECSDPLIHHPWNGMPVPSDASMFDSYISYKDGFDLVSHLGWGWWHAYWPYSSRAIQPHSETEFRWRDTDLMHQYAKNKGFDIMANLAGHGGHTQQANWMVSQTPSKGGASSGTGQMLNDPAKFETFVGHVAQRYRGQVLMWEPWNEPGVKMRAEEYLPYLKGAYQQIKANDPNAMVYGLCGTWDVGGDLMGWVKNGLKLGAAQYMDAISIHGYHVQDRRYVAMVDDLAKQISGRRFDIVDSESGASFAFLPYPDHLDMFPDNGNSVWSNIDMMARLLISELGCGAKRSSWFNLFSYYAGPHYSSFELLDYTLAASPGFVAYNTLTDLLGPAKHLQEIPVGGDVVIHLFDDGHGKPMAWLWADAEPQTICIPVSADSVYLQNLRGTQQPATAKGQAVELKLSKRAVALRSDRLNIPQMAEVLKKTVVQGLPTVEITRVGLTRTTKGEPALAVQLKGRTAQAKPVDVEILKLPADWSLTTPRQHLNPLALDQVSLMVFPFNSKLSAPQPSANVRLSLDNGQGMLTRSLGLKVFASTKTRSSMQIDGSLGDWDASLYQPIEDWAKIASCWNEQGIYFAVQASDSTRLAKTSQYPWQNDCLELYFNPAIERSYQDHNYFPGDVQIISGVKAQDAKEDVLTVAYRSYPFGHEQFQSPTMDPKRIQIKSTRDAKGYQMEIMIPWSNFPANIKAQEGMFLGFSFSIRDVDESLTNKRHYFWAGDNHNYQRTDRYGSLLLLPPSPASPPSSPSSPSPAPTSPTALPR